MSEWIKVATLAQIPALGARIYQHEGIEIAIFRTGDDKVFALDNRCPHKGGPLSEGIVHGGRVTCPLHNWQIDLETGEAQGADTGCSQTYPLKLENGKVLLCVTNG